MQIIKPEEVLSEYYPPLTDHEALVEANRCLYCYDAPCTHACPTHIDIPKFIKKIATGNVVGSARTILESNLMGATCARVCPVQELCEGACVLGAEHKPIAIGRLQRYATDYVYERGIDVFKPGPPTGKKVAVIGAGPAGLTCAGELAKLGHSVTVFEKRELPNGLSTYGIIVLREPVEVAQAEADMVRRLGVEIKTQMELGRNLSWDEVKQGFDAVFLSVGLGAVPRMGIPGEEYILDGLQYIETSKMNPGSLKVGHQVVVIGAGNTAVDCATIAKRLGAERVTMVYRRTEREMTAYDFEYSFVKNEGVEFRFLTQPVEVLVENGQVVGLKCVRMALGAPDASGRPAPEPVPGSEFVLPCDQVVKAIGQEKPAVARLLGLETDKGFIKVNQDYQTSLPGVYAGGDCIRAKGSASTVMAVQDGKLAAFAIHRNLMAGMGAAADD
ncbi:MAG: dihydropyrimidine dehydrogenase subunit A [Meiothermus sp.]|uniref:Dihydropyrimidine dehydrogenase subunit A n=2 Tax=Meiothermus hypogaeus TaxID=884155 RepID=A0A511R107_9DEIN|nr:NAD(P)-dependent oxidoreductase [Meiothermus hypogaeus]RIH80762.1 Glutamate synthase [NADPH] small chain [Meiothermus hypogaeus]GEM83288.1 dihydropyrimidine dehydrogenase subunit A [Meiothermus hypogaeus NBRC 106114]GIW37751.1 MAG: dihydropyrimidine dehydrogenase subunit A [Meiothermus sp.]